MRLHNVAGSVEAERAWEALGFDGRRAGATALHRADALMPLVTISRQYGSGGSEVAERVATALGWQLYDNAVVDEVARRLGHEHRGSVGA